MQLPSVLTDDQHLLFAGLMRMGIPVHFQEICAKSLTFPVPAFNMTVPLFLICHQRYGAAKI
jgi:hypothetical protein